MTMTPPHSWLFEAPITLNTAPAPLFEGSTIPERCKTPKKCPTIRNRATPFSEVNGVGVYNRQGNLQTVSQVEQGLKDALSGFAQDAQSLIFAPAGLRLARIVWMGAYNCRCVSGTDRLSGHAYGRAIDIAGWAFQNSTGQIETVSYERLVIRGIWEPLFRVGACLHLNFPMVLDWTDSNHRNHFHAEIGTTYAKPYWRFIDGMLGRMLGASLLKLGWRSAGSIYVPASTQGQALVNARVAALNEFAQYVPSDTVQLFARRYGRSATPQPGDRSKLLLLSVAKNGLRI